MSWHVAAGVAQLVLIGCFALSFRVASHRRSALELILYVVPMAVLAVGALTGATWAVAVAAIFYSVWVINSLLVWFAPRRPVKRRAVAQAALGLLSVAVLALTWVAAVAAGPTPVV